MHALRVYFEDNKRESVMTDIPIPDEIIAWTKANGWGQHHLTLAY